MQVYARGLWLDVCVCVGYSDDRHTYPRWTRLDIYTYLPWSFLVSVYQKRDIRSFLFVWKIPEIKMEQKKGQNGKKTLAHLYRCRYNPNQRSTTPPQYMLVCVPTRFNPSLPQINIPIKGTLNGGGHLPDISTIIRFILSVSVPCFLLFFAWPYPIKNVAGWDG